MRIAVLNGVNLDVLGRRDPELYGGLALSELETRIYQWAVELRCTARCRQTNHEGEFVDWCHEAYEWADGVIANPGAWSHYSWAIHDALELFAVPVVEVHLSNIVEREEWRRFSVLEDVATRSVHRQGPDGYRQALEFIVGGERERSPARALLEEPLLVAGPPYVLGGQANVRYLTGLQSSNAAVLVEPDGSATLYTDFRYANRARSLDGFEVAEIARGLDRRSASSSPAGGSSSRSSTSRTRSTARSPTPGVDAVPTPRARRGSARRQGRRGDRAIRRAARALRRDLRARSPRSGSRPQRAGARVVGRAELPRSRSARASRSRRSWPPARRRDAARVPGDAPIEPGVLVTVDAGCVVDGYCSDCTRTFAVGRGAGAAAPSCTRSASRRSSPGSRPCAPGVHGRDADAASRNAHRGRRVGAAYGHGMGHGVGLQIHEAPTLRPETTDVLEAGNVVSVEPGIYLPDEGRGVRIEDLVARDRGRLRAADAVHQGA